MGGAAGFSSQCSAIWDTDRLSSSLCPLSLWFLTISPISKDLLPQPLQPVGRGCAADPPARVWTALFTPSARRLHWVSRQARSGCLLKQLLCWRSVILLCHLRFHPGKEQSLPPTALGLKLCKWNSCSSRKGTDILLSLQPPLPRSLPHLLPTLHSPPSPILLGTQTAQSKSCSVPICPFPDPEKSSNHHFLCSSGESE